MSQTIWDHVETLRKVPDSEVGHVALRVDYQIIEHFSEHLYASPNKAIEELVANGFDAFATQVQVFTPGQYTAERVVVWDNGESMDVEGLKKLWWIARSPKEDGDRVEERQGKKRKIIGKFGIGKLASYSVGQVISHVCRCAGDFYIVSIDYADVQGRNGTPPVSSDRPVHAPIVRLDGQRAMSLVKSLFDSAPPSLDDMLQQESWTFAVIERLKVHDLPQGRLMWVLGNGMPLRPDFSVRVNESSVASKLNKRATIEWDFGSEAITNAIEARWREAAKRGEVTALPTFDSDVELDPFNPTVSIPFARFAKLGQVWGQIRLFDNTLLGFRAADHGRSHGFFLIVRGRLINPDDDKLLLPDPSFQSFYRSHFVLNIDDLDDNLLADRQRLREEEAVRSELELLQKTLAAVARANIEARDEENETSQTTRSVLPVGSRIYYRDPLNALLLREAIDKFDDLDPSGVSVERKPLGAMKPISEFVLEENAFHVNSEHPYYSTILARTGQSRVAREFLRTMDLFAISERLLEGHLLDIGLDDHHVTEIVDWREGLLKRLAAAYDKGPRVIEEMHRLSYVGGTEFEKAVRDVFEDMGFVAQHDGASGEKDVLVMATVGPESYRLTVEAKGSKSTVNNREAHVGAAVRHRRKVNADHAVIVAREFAGFADRSGPENAALYGECEEAGGVSIMETAALEKLHAAIVRFSYPLPLLRDVFTRLDTPSDKMKAVDGLATPVEGFNYRELLEQIWDRQGSTAEGDVVAYRSVYQEGAWKHKLSFDEFQQRLVALDTLAAGRIVLRHVTNDVYLRQSPELILAQIEKTLYGEGHGFEEEKEEDDAQNAS